MSNLIEKKRLGLIAGKGKFPMIFAKEAKRQGYDVIAVGIKGDASFCLRFAVDKFLMVHVGDMKGVIRFFLESKVEQVIMAGQVNQNNLFKSNVEFDDELQDMFNSMEDRKADTIFAAIGNKLKENSIELVNSTLLIKDYLSPAGTLTKKGPSRTDLLDIEFGIKIAKAMGKVDVGQTVVISDRAIVAVEAMEGTNKTILRGGRIARSKAVVVKASKPDQDLRFDVPVIGPKTIETMIRVKAGCLAIEAGKTIIINKNKCIKLADKAGICIVAA